MAEVRAEIAAHRIELRLIVDDVDLGQETVREEDAVELTELEPAVAVLSAWIFLGEGLSRPQWAGAVLVLAAAMLAARGSPGDGQAK